MSTHDASWGAHDASSVVMRRHQLSTQDASWVLMMHHGYAWCIMKHPWGIISIHDASWVLMMHHENSRCIMGAHDASWIKAQCAFDGRRQIYEVTLVFHMPRVALWSRRDTLEQFEYVSNNFHDLGQYWWATIGAWPFQEGVSTERDASQGHQRHDGCKYSSANAECKSKAVEGNEWINIQLVAREYECDIY